MSESKSSTFFKNILRKIPFKTRKRLRSYFYQILNIGFNYRPEEGLQSLKRKMALYFWIYPKKKVPFANEISFLKLNSSDLSYSVIFPYKFVLNYNFNQVLVDYNANKELFYAFHNQKKLYYNKSYSSEDAVKVQYYCISVEQDRDSPHCYIKNNSFTINPGDIVVDIGSAEGNFALDYIESIGHLYLFEANPLWKYALEATYEPWKEKVTIVDKYVSDIDSENSIRLDTYFKNQPVNCIKIDVEGAEEAILKGATNTLKHSPITLFVCTYHQQNDAQKLTNIFTDLNFQYEYSEGYMLFTLNKLAPPYFRKCLIRVKNY